MWVHFYVQLCVISLTVKWHSKVTKDWPLRDPTGNSVCPWSCTFNGDVLCPVGKIRVEPVESSVSESYGVMWPVEKYRVVYSVECCRQVEYEERGWASIGHHQQVVCDPHQGCFSAVSGAETRLRPFEKVFIFQELLFLVPWREWKVGNGHVVGKDFRVQGGFFKDRSYYGSF